jgi:hypothetical protein
VEPALQLESKIRLGDVSGRIDHIAIDLNRHRIFVAELGNNTVEVVDLNERKVIHVFRGLKEPQGVAYVPSSDTLYIANAGDGSVRIFRADNFELAGQIDLGDDADNIRVDEASNRVIIGYGNGALAVIDPATRRKIADISLVDVASGKQTASWSLKSRENFPMAVDDENKHVVVAFRSPPRLGVFSARDGASVADVELCGDADDVFIDTKRHRAYVSCGGGFLDVFDTQGATYRRMAHIPTVPGARTSLFVPELDRLLLAVRASAGEPAAIWIYRPTP